MKHYESGAYESQKATLLRRSQNVKLLSTGNLENDVHADYNDIALCCIELDSSDITLAAIAFNFDQLRPRQRPFESRPRHLPRPL